MSQTHPTLHLLCGKAASGKSTLSARLAEQPQTIVVAEDDWLATLFADRMTSLADYLDCAEKLRTVMTPHIVALLRAGVSVVLDFPANTVETRRWMRGLVETSDSDHRLHYLDVPDAVCKARVLERNARGDHPFAVSEAQFERLLKHFVPPSEDEGFNIVRHSFHAGA